MMKNILVTAFFDIGRGNAGEYSIPRKTDLYYRQFSHWCGIHNPLVCCCDPDMGDRIRQIREDKGLLDITTVIEMDITNIPEFQTIRGGILQFMKYCEKDNHTQDVHLINNAMSGRAKYSYVMYVKYICLCRAAELYGKESISLEKFK